MKIKFDNEQALAEVVVERLKADGWEVFQEVQVFSTIADMVARKDSKLWIIETKTTLNLDVLGQAYDWRGFADKVSVAVPASRRSRGRNFAYEVCKQYKIGIITVSPNMTFNKSPWWYIESDYENDKVDPVLRKRLESSLTELHKTWSKAGSQSGGHLTPFKLTEMNIQDYVRKNPGCTIKDVISNIQTHYANPTAGVCGAVSKGWIKNVVAKKEKNKFKLYYEEQ